MKCDSCDRELKEGEVIQIRKTAIITGDDYEPDGENFEKVCEDCI